ncbi:MAG TPA: 7-carboxy-7-deazaguanine synthase QueE [Tepidisphaeraceae bacterium]|jgi:7-carboxy-7-deazaguanine synthase
MKISEIFYSIQGEGKLVGLPSVFVRVSGCNLRCVWCDTPYASWNPEGEEIAIDEIVRRVRRYECKNVVLTGGEPMIMPDVAELCAAIKSGNHHLTIETAGTVFENVQMDLASISPKLSNSTPIHREAGRFAASHDKQRLRPDVIQQFIDSAPDFQLKFVVSAEDDLREIEQLLNQLRGWKADDVLLMPEGTEASILAERAHWLVEVCKRTGFRFCPRLHVELFGNVRGT